jgi:hypothetical protein
MLHQPIQLPPNKRFGLFFAMIFAAITAYLLSINLVSASIFLASLSIVFFMLALIKSDLLLPFNKAWMYFGMSLGLVISPIVMGIIFFALFTPIGVLMRIFGRDELRLKIKPVSSHWKVREPQMDISNSFKHQF